MFSRHRSEALPKIIRDEDGKEIEQKVYRGVDQVLLFIYLFIFFLLIIFLFLIEKLTKMNN